jgi:hypothetical protein
MCHLVSLQVDRMFTKGKNKRFINYNKEHGTSLLKKHVLMNFKGV